MKPSVLGHNGPQLLPEALLQKKLHDAIEYSLQQLENRGEDA